MPIVIFSDEDLHLSPQDLQQLPDFINVMIAVIIIIYKIIVIHGV